MLLSKKHYSFILLFLFVQNYLFSQEGEWKKEFSKDGKIEVLSKLSKSTDQEGNSIQIIEYKSTTITDLALEKCTSALKDINNHKEFYSDTEVSKKIRDISDNEALVYFYIDSSWPLPNSDCVSIMTVDENEADRSVRFTLLAAADEMEMKDVKRMTISTTIYTFKELEDKKVVFEIESKFSPVINAPLWLVKSWFPDGVIEMNENIIALIKSQ